MRGKKLTYKERMALLHSSPTERIKIFKDLKYHVIAGFSLDCFAPMSEKTIKEFTNIYPEEFSEDELIEAMRKGKEGWESIGRRQADGTCIGNSRSWYYNMSNRYGWSDRLDQKQEHSGQVQVQVVNYSSPTPSK